MASVKQELKQSDQILLRLQNIRNTIVRYDSTAITMIGIEMIASLKPVRKFPLPLMRP